MDELKFRKNDVKIIILLAFVAVSCYVIGSLYAFYSTGRPVAEVTVDGELYGSYDLEKSQEIRIELKDGDYNILHIENGRAEMTEASCPDKICVHHKSISRNKETIVCLPHKLLVQIKNGEENDLDGVVK